MLPILKHGFDESACFFCHSEVKHSLHLHFLQHQPSHSLWFLAQLKLLLSFSFYVPLSRLFSSLHDSSSDHHWSEKILPSGGAAQGSSLAGKRKAILAYRTSFPWAGAVLSDLLLLRARVTCLVLVPQVSSTSFSHKLKTKCHRGCSSDIQRLVSPAEVTTIDVTSA